MLMFLFMLRFIAAQPTLKSIDLGSVYQNESVKADQFNYYKLVVKAEDYKAEQDLIIKVIPLKPNEDPDLYISKKNMFPNSSAESQLQCTSYGKDICTINSQDVQVDDVFYLGITSMYDDCSYQIATSFEQEINLEDGIDLQLHLYEEDVRVFKYYIPESITDSSLIIIKASAFSPTAHYFILSVASSENGNAAGTSLQSIDSIQAWKKGQVIKLTKENYHDNWCPGCIVKILLDVKDLGEYHIEVKTTDFVPWIHNEEQVDDIVSFDSVQCYQYFIQQSNTDLQVQLTTYSGRVSIQANPNEIPNNWDDFKIKIPDKETAHGAATELILDMRPWLRKNVANAETGLYYICVRGELTSTYSLRLREFVEKFNSPIEILDGYSEYFYSTSNSRLRFVYNVPKLEYEDEDIDIIVDLEMRNGISNLKLLGSMCQTSNIDVCAEQANTDLILSKSSYMRADNVGSDRMRLVINHNETKCQEIFNGHYPQKSQSNSESEQQTNTQQNVMGQCTYIFIVVNPVIDQEQLFKIVATHSQKNHIMLQESVPHTDSTEMKEYKYFSFSVIGDEVQEVLIEMTPLHGDSDLYVSTSQKFPNKKDYEQKSQRIGDQIDTVTFFKKSKNQTDNITNLTEAVRHPKNSSKDSLQGTYYIGVYGYIYSTFQLLVTVKRTQTNTNASNIDSNDKLILKSTAILEGHPMSKTLHNELQIFIGRFEVNIPEGDDSAILIDIKNTKGKTKSLIRYGGKPSSLNYDFKLSEGSIMIKPGDQAYHTKGSYFILTVPDFNLIDLFIDNYYGFTITWRTENTVPTLNSLQILPLSTQPQEYTQLKHYVQDNESDIRIQLITKGLQDVYVTVRQNKTLPPTNQTYDFSTKYVRGSNYAHGKSLFLPMELLKQMNPACVDLGFATDGQCVLYISVYCLDQTPCSSEIEIDYESDIPKKVNSGQTKHSVIQKDTKQYYYYNVNKDNIGDIYATLSPINNWQDLDLYVTIFTVDTQNINNDAFQWWLPTETNYTYASKTKFNQEIFTISTEELLNNCNFTIRLSTNDKQNEECLLVFGIFPPEQENGTLIEGFEELIYNFVVYKDIMELKPMVPSYGYVKVGDFSYFLYRESCTNCTIIISVSSYSNGDPDIYINKGGSKLPTLDEYDFMQGSLHSEVLEIDLEDDYFQMNNITSVEGYYLIGIYGNTNSTFQITVSSEMESITQLFDGVSLKHQQEPEEVAYFQYYHFNSQSDILISIQMNLGSADLYVATFIPQGKDDFFERLPSLKNKSHWSVDTINSMNQNELLILQTDRHYCDDCYYLIGVRSDQSIQYQISVQTIQAQRNFTHLMRVGVPKNIKFIMEDFQEPKIFQFMLENNAQTVIVPTIISGTVKIYLSNSESRDDAFIETNDGKEIELFGHQIKTEENYYIIVEPVTNTAELLLTIHQDQAILGLQDGIPMQITFSDYEDATRYMIYYIEEGNSTVVINVKSKTEFFFPKLMMIKYDMNDPESENYEFAPTEQERYSTFYEEWDFDLYLMRVSIPFQNIPRGGAFLALTLQYYTPQINTNLWNPSPEDDTSAKAIITVSSSAVIKIAENEDYFGFLGKDDSKAYAFKMIQIEPPVGKAVQIIFSQCVGMSQFGVLKDPEEFNDRYKFSIKNVNGNQIALLKDVSGVAYIIIETFNEEFEVHRQREYMIRVRYVEADNENEHKFTTYVPQDDGHISFEYMKASQNNGNNINLKWGNLMIQGISRTEKAYGVRYKLVFSEDLETILTSACALKRHSSATTIFESKDMTVNFKHHLEANVETQFNVIAVIDSEQIVVPYNPIILKVPENMTSTGGQVTIILLAAILLFIGFLALFFFIKGKVLQKKLYKEIRDVKAQNGGNQTYFRVNESKSIDNVTEEF